MLRFAETGIRNANIRNSMTETENSGDFLEAAAPEVEEMSDAPAPEETTEAPQEEHPQERNFRALRESNERLQREREQDRQMMMALQEEVLRTRRSQESQPVEEPDMFADVDPSDYTTVEQMLAYTQKIADARSEKVFEKKWAEYERKRKEEELPTRLKTRFPDFDSVVTTDNVKQLQALEPDVAQVINQIGDNEAKAVAAYKYIKALVPSAVEASQDKKRIEENANLPKSVSAAKANSPLGKAGSFEQGLTPDLKRQLWAEMNACAKQG